MKLLERSFWKKIDAFLQLDFIGRVENSAGVGWGDVHYCHGSPGWIELKATKKFPNKIKFEPGQPIWLERYWNAGGYCFIWLYVEQENTVYIWLGRHAKALGESGGTREIKPFLEIEVNAQGWAELNNKFDFGFFHEIS